MVNWRKVDRWIPPDKRRAAAAPKTKRHEACRRAALVNKRNTTTLSWQLPRRRQPRPRPTLLPSSNCFINTTQPIICKE
ncbi:hypothetical protein J6590_027720 [Homalodisca vitripennis]|nr:hypothetical protein J6590_027720 [Homalodisca vitripennis]